MATASAAAIDQKGGLLPGLLMGDASAGTLAALLVFLDTRLHSGSGPSVVLRAIASGLLGTHAFFRGTGTAFLGLVLHFFVACVLASSIIVYARTYRVVLPLSAFPKSLWWQCISFRTRTLWIFAHTLLIGPPIALAYGTAQPGRRICNPLRFGSGVFLKRGA
jgi:hypothetical protein